MLMYIARYSLERNDHSMNIALQRQVYKANLMLPKYGLVKLTWGNASGVDREEGLVVIKPSGLAYEEMVESHMVSMDLETGKKVGGAFSPSTDAPTHLALYRAFPNIGGVVHTHSRWATMFAQAGMGIPALGTTHADYFYGEIPCARKMTADEIARDYEANTGKVIAELFSGADPDAMPAALVPGHGPFVWGKSPLDAVHNAVVLEEIAFMAWHNIMMDPDIAPIQRELLDKHYLRKHGPDAYYGQK